MVLAGGVVTGGNSGEVQEAIRDTDIINPVSPLQRLIVFILINQSNNF